MEGLKIIQPGVLATLQDMGRKGYQQYGMPTAGAMDPFALQAGNILVGNPREEAALEITFPGWKGVFLSPCRIAITGGDLGTKINGRYIPLWRAFDVSPGSELSFEELREGCRAYLCAAGGWEVPVIMGSKSTYLRGDIGGYAGRKLESGDILSVRYTRNHGHKQPAARLPIADVPHYGSPCTLRVIPGPQAEAFTQESVKRFFTQTYRVGAQSDRMGYRLEGSSLQHRESADIISDGIPLGAIQVPGHGMPIIMLMDRQTTGGYPKIATVISADIPRLAQLKPGDLLSFQEVTIEEAHLLLKQQEKVLRRMEDCSVSPLSEREFDIQVDGKKYEVSVEEYAPGGGQ